MQKNGKRIKEKIDTPEKRAKLLCEMTKHVGETNAISMAELYELVYDKPWANKISDTRYVRYLVTTLRDEGIAICSTSNAAYGGYYLAAAGSEIHGYLRRMETRALKILKRVSTIKRLTLPEYLGQMHLRMTAQRVKEEPDAA
ncbi:MAG: hypothetical protein LC132_07890 [Burkholderiales bacterium]|jgi:hypothetical protein|nr:hypothetical protein [Burkholderiales bacterium]